MSFQRSDVQNVSHWYIIKLLVSIVAEYVSLSHIKRYCIHCEYKEVEEYFKLHGALKTSKRE